jgi:hypothetical protein
MNMRMKDQADFDLEAFADLFDRAMSSDNPTVRRAFKNLLIVAAIDSTDSDGLRMGPLRRLIEDQKALIERLNRLEQYNWTINTPTPGTGSPMMPYQPGYGPVPMPTTWPTIGTGTGAPPNQIWCASQAQSASSTAYDDQFKPEPV